LLNESNQNWIENNKIGRVVTQKESHVNLAKIIFKDLKL